MAFSRADSLDLSSDDDNLESVTINLSDISACEGVPRRQWITKVVSLRNEVGKSVAEGICYSVSSSVVFGCNGPLGDSMVAVQISKSLSADHVPEGWKYSLRAWPIDRVYLNGASLMDHEIRYEHPSRQDSLSQSSTYTSRPYSTVIRIPATMSCVKSATLLSQESINLVSSKVCCSVNCVQPVPREKIKSFRKRMYNKITYEFRYHMKLDVHRQVHRNSSGRRMVTVEGVDVCLLAWRFISGVSETTFHWFQAYAKNGKLSQPHGNVRTQKTRKHTLQATATLKHMLHKSADHMPHKIRTLLSGDKVVSRVLLASFRWNETISKINTVNVVFGLKVVSASNICKIKKAHFSEFSAKKSGDNFARCSKCDNLKSLKRSASSALKEKWSKELDEHLAIAESHRDQYYSNRHMSMAYPHEVLTVIHNKMDHAKTAFPVFSHKSKQLDGLFKLPVSVTGMIAHHGDVRYVHYGLDIFFNDSNYTIGSLAKFLRDLEKPPTYSSRELFAGSGSAPLYQAVLKGKDMCNTSLRSASKIPVPTLSLPPTLNVQMDNATGDNKNRFVFAFWSLLVAKKLFQEIYVSFMLVGHTQGCLV